MSRAAAKQERIREIHRRLKRAYGPLDEPRHLEPVEELVLTILSQNTNDTNRDRAYEAMRRRFPSWDALAEAREKDLIETIRVGGLANTKAPRIILALREIRAREGGFDLSWMYDAPNEAVHEYLISLPGVGPKTVACVLAFSLRRSVIPVDTHVLRVATRLGLLPEGTGATLAHELLDSLIPPRLRLPMHVGLIRHGRAVCRAGLPFCEGCVLQDLCPSASRFLRIKRGLVRTAQSRRSGSRKGAKHVDNP